MARSLSNKPPHPKIDVEDCSQVPFKNNTKIDANRRLKERKSLFLPERFDSSRTDGIRKHKQPPSGLIFKRKTTKQSPPTDVDLQRIRGSLSFSFSGFRKIDVTQHPGCSAAFLSFPDTSGATPTCADMFLKRLKVGVTWK